MELIPYIKYFLKTSHVHTGYGYGTVFISDKVSKARNPQAAVKLQIFVYY